MSRFAATSSIDEVSRSDAVEMVVYSGAGFLWIMLIVLIVLMMYEEAILQRPHC